MKTEDRALKYVRAFERDGKTVRKVLIDGRKIELTLDDGTKIDDFDAVDMSRAARIS